MLVAVVEEKGLDELNQAGLRRVTLSAALDPGFLVLNFFEFLFSINKRLLEALVIASTLELVIGELAEAGLGCLGDDLFDVILSRLVLEVADGAEGDSLNEGSEEGVVSLVLGLLQVNGITSFLLGLHDFVDFEVNTRVSDRAAHKEL